MGNGNMFSIANQSALEAARIGFHAAFMEALEDTAPDPLEELYSEVRSSNSLEEWEWLGDLPGFEEWKGDRVLADMEAFKLQVANRDWASGLRLHQNQIKDDKLGLFAPLVPGLAMKAKKHRSDICVQNLINGFDGTAYPGLGSGLAYDGKFFFSATHASGSNLLTTALSKDAVYEANEMLEEQQTMDGKDPLDMSGTTLIVGPHLRPTAERILSSIIVNTAGDGAESNPLANRFRLLVSKRLRGDYHNYWFLADTSTPIKPCIFQLREDISTSAIVGGQGTQQDSVPRFKKGEIWFGAEARYNVALFAFQSIVGSKVTA